MAVSHTLALANLYPIGEYPSAELVAESFAVHVADPDACPVCHPQPDRHAHFHAHGDAGRHAHSHDHRDPVGWAGRHAHSALTDPAADGHRF